jgi:hypothetical protein
MYATLHATAIPHHASDAEMLTHLEARVGPEVASRARARAEQLVAAAAADGTLQRLADELHRRHVLPRGELVRQLEKEQHD